jgi:cytochrome P450
LKGFAISTTSAAKFYAFMLPVRLVPALFTIYTKAISTAVMIWRQAAKPVYIENIYIPAGTNVIVSPQVSQSHPHIWGDSAEDFEPDRWDSLSPESASPYAFQAFSSGPRVCIGKMLAMLEFKAILLDIVRKYSFEPIGEKLVLENYLTLRPKGGLRVRFRPIKA